MNKELLVQIYNTLNEVEVKGFDNINRLFGVMYTIKQELEKTNNSENTKE